MMAACSGCLPGDFQSWPADQRAVVETAMIAASVYGSASTKHAPVTDVADADRGKNGAACVSYRKCD